ncbi:MAG: hypothetical protein K1X94_00980 [Sandaracinaceae bacterium]|nr:hypothetical protein [Sandaracinaceae bacterium]
MLWVAAVKCVAMVFAARSASHAGLAAWVALSISLLASVVLPIALALLGHDVSSWVRLAPPSLLVASVGGAWATRTAFAALSRVPAGSPEEETISRGAYALLGNAVLDSGLFVIAGLVWALNARSDTF